MINMCIAGLTVATNLLVKQQRGLNEGSSHTAVEHQKRSNGKAPIPQTIMQLKHLTRPFQQLFLKT